MGDGKAQPMVQKVFSAFLILCLFSACAPQRAQRGPVTPKSFVTPWEFYQKTRPAVYTPEDEAHVQQAAVHSTGEDTREDKVNMVLIGSLVGVLVVGGTVAGILLAR